MPPGERFVIETADFVDRDEAASFFRGMLARLPAGTRVGPADAMHLRALLGRHPDAAAKVGPGVAGFTVIRTEHAGRCFAAVRTDGSVVDFSVRHCIHGRAASPFQSLKRALRVAVRADVEVLRGRAGADDGAPFGLIVKAYLESRGLDARSLALVSRPGFATPVVADEAVVADFRAFHRERASAPA